MKNTIEIKAGILLCGKIRDGLRKAKLISGKDFEWIESSGLFQRTFTIKGEEEDLEVILEALEKWKKENNL